MTTATRSRKKKPRVVKNSTLMARLEKMSRESDRSAIEGGWKTKESLELARETADVWKSLAPRAYGSAAVYPFCRGVGAGAGIYYVANFSVRLLIPNGIEPMPHELLWALMREAQFELHNLECGINRYIHQQCVASNKERQKRKPASSVVENLPQQNEKARDAVGRAVGVSGKIGGAK